MEGLKKYIDKNNVSATNTKKYKNKILQFTLNELIDKLQPYYSNLRNLNQYSDDAESDIDTCDYIYYEITIKTDGDFIQFIKNNKLLQIIIILSLKSGDKYSNYL